MALHSHREMEEALKIRILTSYNPGKRSLRAAPINYLPQHGTTPVTHTISQNQTNNGNKNLWKPSLEKDTEDQKEQSATTLATNYKVILEFEYDYETGHSTNLSFLLAPSPSSPGPYIDTYHSANVTALSGITTFLNCRVHKLGNKTVSWIRQDNLHLLTVGRYTYTSDLRFEASHVPHSVDWTLTIRDPQPEDSGMYQCQVSTTPHMAIGVALEVKGTTYLYL